MRDSRSDNCSRAPMGDVTLIFGEDVLEWDAYLTQQLEAGGASVRRLQLECTPLPPGAAAAAALSSARATLVVVSPALLRFLERRAEDGFRLARLLAPSRTIAMLCGASPHAVAALKNVLVSYDEWRHVEAKDKDINMVRDVIEMILETLSKSKENERINKPKYKLVPRKVQEFNSKVYVILTKPLDGNSRIRVTIEANGSREVAVKKRNPYTLTFIVPDDLIHVQNMVSVHVWCDEDLLGVSQVKCVSKLGELYSLLVSCTSPYEFLCNSLGFSSLYEVDTQLAALFRKNVPKVGFNVLHSDGKQEKNSTKEEFPTLLHFAARYGLFQLVKELLDCPGASTAATMKNTQGLTPAQLANHEGHVKTASSIDEFLQQTVCYTYEKEEVENVIAPCQILCESSLKKSNPIDYYDIPAQPVPVLHLSENRTLGNAVSDRDCDYMKMKGSHKENIEPFQIAPIQLNGKDNQLPHIKSTNTAEHAKLTLLESQTKLIEIMEAYKKGASLTEVERLHNEWKTLYQVSDTEAKSTLDGLRNLYAKAQKAKLNKKHSSSFSELRHFLNFKLRRKDSIGSKGTLSRRSSKDSMNFKKDSAEPDPVRPVSTLSVLSNTSSSSGSSFDRLSMASAGSDSGHHSDFGEERNNKFRERYESRYQQQRRAIGTTRQLSLESSNFQSKLQSLTLNSKPPAPPPRPAKPSSHYGSLEDCKSTDIPQYSVLKKKVAAPSYEETLKLLDYSIPSSKCLTLGNDFRYERKGSLANIEDPLSDYDCVPPPVSCLLQAPPCEDYDIVPPPLPLSAPPGIEDPMLAYDILPSVSHLTRTRSSSVSSNYDFPKTSFTDNTDTKSTCNCNIAISKSNLNSVKSCCLDNKLLSLKRMDNLPSVPKDDVAVAKSLPQLKERAIQNQYCNVFMVPARADGHERDSIPEEMAPPPPCLGAECPEEHYKLVPAPLPVSAGFKVS